MNTLTTKFSLPLATLSILLFMPLTTFAATLNFSVEDKKISTDENLIVHLSVDGQVDNGQIGIKGMENFDIVGQQSSSQIQIINGQTTMVQEKILSLHPKTSGKFSLTALAKENGETIESDTFEITVEKSLIEATKENLLKNSQENNQETENKKTQDTQDEKQENSSNNTLKNLLTTPSSNTGKSTNMQYPEKKLGTLQAPEFKNFPKVEHISPFNMLFWAESIGLFLAILTMLFGVLWGIKKVKRK